MNVVKFAEEFTQLMIRWTKPSATKDNDADNLVAPLTNQQLLTTMQDVLNVILSVKVQISDYSSVTTPATGIAVCTPSAPVVPKLNVDQNSGSLSRFRSLDTLTTSMPQSEKISLPNSGALSSKSEEKMDIAETEASGPPSEEKKSFSRSSPAIHVNNVNRSDTFVRENDEKDAKISDKSREEFNDVFAKSDFDFFCDVEKMKSNAFFQKLETLRKCAFEVVSKIDEVKKEVRPQTTKPIRRLSSIGGLSRSSTMMRPILPPKLRRSSTGFPGTPTSSKLDTTITAEKEQGSARSKGVAAASSHAKSAKINAISPSNGCTSSLYVPLKKKSPLANGRSAKNPKYAHVQSTIPKQLMKRKAQ